MINPYIKDFWAKKFHFCSKNFLTKYFFKLTKSYRGFRGQRIDPAHLNCDLGLLNGLKPRTQHFSPFFQLIWGFWPSKNTFFTFPRFSKNYFSQKLLRNVLEGISDLFDTIGGLEDPKKVPFGHLFGVR